jgi:hypothetical protein
MSHTHVVITGTGRTGTSFLVQLLTYLGLDTGFSPSKMVLHADARAGLEYDIRATNPPYIIKNPDFCDYAEDVIQNRKDIIIERVFIPMRDLHAAAESRRHVFKVAKAKLTQDQWAKVETSPRGSVPGGLWNGNDDFPQEIVLSEKHYKLTLALSDSDIPITLMRYPRIVRDSQYLYTKLRPILKEITYEQFEQVFNRTVRPEWVHSFNTKDG